MSVSIFVPAHITGFFSIHDDRDPLKKGSTGVGFLLDKGVTTSIKPTRKDETSIKINGKTDNYNQNIILKVLELMDIDQSVKIDQKIQVPIGSGFGTSAASALSSAIGLSEAFGLDNNIIKSGQIAHLAEVNLGSGLGDVSAQLGKGIVIRRKPGAPGIGEIESVEEELYVGCKSFGEISTKSIINDPNYKKAISEIGSEMQEEFMINSNSRNFIDKSLEFSRKTKLITEEVKKARERLSKDENIIGSSMAMLGNTVFALSKNKESLSGLDIYKINNEGIAWYSLAMT